MINSKIMEFYTEMREEIINGVKNRDYDSTISAFKNIFVSFLVETGDTTLADCTYLDFKKDADKIRLDGYAYSDYFHSLTLLVSVYEVKEQPGKLWKTEIDKQLKKALKFFKACDSDYFEDMEESGDGYQAYEFIRDHKKEIETVTIVLITNNEAINFVPEDSKAGKGTDQWFYERARGQYLVELGRQPTASAKKQFKERCPKNRCISKTVAAKCVMAWMGYPDIVSKGLETNFVFFSEKIQNGEISKPSTQSYTEIVKRERSCKTTNFSRSFSFLWD